MAVASDVDIIGPDANWLEKSVKSDVLDIHSYFSNPGGASNTATVSAFPQALTVSSAGPTFPTK